MDKEPLPSCFDLGDGLAGEGGFIVGGGELGEGAFKACDGLAGESAAQGSGCSENCVAFRHEFAIQADGGFAALFGDGFASLRFLWSRFCIWMRVLFGAGWGGAVLGGLLRAEARGLQRG